MSNRKEKLSKDFINESECMLRLSIKDIISFIEEQPKDKIQITEKNIREIYEQAKTNLAEDDFISESYNEAISNAINEFIESRKN